MTERDSWGPTGPPDPAVRAVALAASLVAAFLWATYYLFVLWVRPTTGAGAIIVYPFLAGGLAFAALAAIRGEGRAFLALWADGAAWARTALLLLMQWLVLAATFLAGPVDSALLSLIGDVVATPLLAAALFASATPFLRRPLFLLGLALSVAGGSLAIVGGEHLSSVPPLGWLAVGTLPIAVAAYFLLSADAARRLPLAAVIGQATLAAALVSVGLSALAPGGAGAVLRISPDALGLLAVNGLASFFVAQLLYFRAIRSVGLGLPPLLMTGIPIFTLALSAFVLHLPLALLGLLGLPIAVVGSLLALRGEHAPRPRRAAG